MKPKAREGADLFERDPKTGQKTDARIWDAMLNGDTKDRLNLDDKTALDRRRKERSE